MKVEHLMTKGADSVAPNCSIQAAAERMKKLNVGILAVCDETGLRGIVTDRDIVVRAVAAGVDTSKMAVGEIMSRDPICCRADANIKTVARMMEGRHVRRIPVRDGDDQLVGMLSLDDFTKRRPGKDMVAEILGAAAARHA